MNSPNSEPADPYVESFPEMAPFWAAAARGVFLVPRCTRCGEVHWHPRAHCPLCHSADLMWVEATGRGSIYSFSVVRRSNQPYVLAYVQIDEGPILMTNLVDCEPGTIEVGMAVEVGFRPTAQGRHAPVFRLAEQRQ